MLTDIFFKFKDITMACVQSVCNPTLALIGLTLQLCFDAIYFNCNSVAFVLYPSFINGKRCSPFIGKAAVVFSSLTDIFYLLF